MMDSIENILAISAGKAMTFDRRNKNNNFVVKPQGKCVYIN